MITGHVINSSSCRNYSNQFGTPSKHYPQRTMLNFRDRSLRVISTVLERLGYYSGDVSCTFRLSLALEK